MGYGWGSTQQSSTLDKGHTADCLIRSSCLCSPLPHFVVSLNQTAARGSQSLICIGSTALLQFGIHACGKDQSTLSKINTIKDQHQRSTLSKINHQTIKDQHYQRSINTRTHPSRVWTWLFTALAVSPSMTCSCVMQGVLAVNEPYSYATQADPRTSPAVCG